MIGEVPEPDEFLARITALRCATELVVADAAHCMGNPTPQTVCAYADTLLAWLRPAEPTPPLDQPPPTPV